MKKKVVLLASLLSLFFLTIIGCNSQVFDVSDSASITIKLPGNDNRAAFNKNTLFYKIKCETEDGNLITEKTASSGEKLQFDELLPGTYTITANAYYSEKVQRLLYSGNETVNLTSGEEKSVTIQLKYVGPKTDVPLDLYNYQDRNNCARIVLEDSYFYVDTTNPYNLKPSHFYWFCKDGFIEALSGEKNDLYSTTEYATYLSDAYAGSFGVIVKFEDDSYAIRSFIVDALLEGNSVISSIYKESATSSGKGKFVYSCKYPNVSDSNKLEFFVTPLDSFLEKGKTITSTELHSTTKENTVFTSSSKMKVDSAKETFEADLEPGWYMADAKITVYNDGYRSSSSPDIYELRTAVYVEENYTLTYSCDFPFDEYYSSYWYKFDWDLNGASWPAGIEVPEYCNFSVDTTQMFKIPAPSAAYGTLEGFTSSPDIGTIAIEYNDSDNTYTLLIHGPSSCKQNVKLTAQWVADVSSMDEFKTAIGAANVGKIYMAGATYSFDETINVNHSVSLVPKEECRFERSSGFLQEMFVVESDGSKEVTLDFSKNESNFVIFEGSTTETYEKSAIQVNNAKSTLKIANCMFDSIKCKNNGAVVNCVEGTVLVDNCMFDSCVLVQNDTEGVKGGAIFVKDGKLTVKNNSSFTSNTAVQKGGAIYIEGESGELSIQSTEFTGNTAEQYGGAIHCEKAKITITGSTFKKNTSTISWGNGGAIMINVHSTAELTNLTFGTDDNANVNSGNGGNNYCIWFDDLESGDTLDDAHRNKVTVDDTTSYQESGNQLIND